MYTIYVYIEFPVTMFYALDFGKSTYQFCRIFILKIENNFDGQKLEEFDWPK